jgi:menaquinone-dependent protoporphyrinogen oxidase
MDPTGAATVKPILVLYATREGHCRLLAEHIAARLRDHGQAAYVVDAKQVKRPFQLSGYSGALLISPVHATLHAHELEQFLRDYAFELGRMPSLVLSVSLSQAGLQLGSVTDAQRAKAQRDVSLLIDKLAQRTGWPPAKVVPVARCLAYTRYGFFKRLILRRIARASGGSTDTSRDHVYTDFAALDRCVDAFVAALRMPTAQAAAAPLSAAP